MDTTVKSCKIWDLFRFVEVHHVEPQKRFSPQA